MAQDLPVHGMREAGVHPPAVRANFEKPEPFRLLDRLRRDHLLEHRQAQRLGDGQQLDDGDGLGRQPAQTSTDQLHEAVRCGDGTAQRPHAVVIGERSGLEPAIDQLSEIEGVSPAHLEEAPHGCACCRSAQHGDHERLEVRLGQRSKVEAVGKAVFPQRRDRLRRRPRRAHARHEAARPRMDELVDEGGGTVVEEMGVIDYEQQPPLSVASAGDGVGSLAQQPGQILRRDIAHGEQRGERAERDRRRRPRASDVSGPVAEPGGRIGGFGCESVFPTPASPASTKATGSGPRSAATIRSSSRARPTNGTSAGVARLTGQVFHRPPPGVTAPPPPVRPSPPVPQLAAAAGR